MQTKKIVIASIFVVLIFTLFIIFPTSLTPGPSDIFKTSGTVEAIFVGDTKDLVLKLKDDNCLYYVANNGEIPIEALKESLPGKPVEVFYVKEWNLLRPFSVKHQIAKVSIDNQDFFSKGNIPALF